MAGETAVPQPQPTVAVWPFGFLLSDLIDCGKHKSEMLCEINWNMHIFFSF